MLMIPDPSSSSPPSLVSNEQAWPFSPSRSSRFVVTLTLNHRTTLKTLPRSGMYVLYQRETARGCHDHHPPFLFHRNHCSESFVMLLLSNTRAGNGIRSILSACRLYHVLPRADDFPISLCRHTSGHGFNGLIRVRDYQTVGKAFLLSGYGGGWGWGWMS